MRVALFLIATLASGAARADDGDEEPVSQRFFSMPLIAGIGVLGGVTPTIGLRPELVFASMHYTPGYDDHERGDGEGHGIGAYVEWMWEAGAIEGAGVTYARYQHGMALAPSVGIYRRPGDYGTVREHGIACGLFFGARHTITDWDHIDMPIGLRADVRLGYDGDRERSVILSVQVDLILGALGAAPILML